MAKEKKKSNGFRNFIILLILLFIAYWFFLKDYIVDFMGPSDDEISEVTETEDSNQNGEPVIVFTPIYDTIEVTIGEEFDPWEYVTITYNGELVDSSEITLTSNLADLIADNPWGDEPNTYSSVMFWAEDSNGFDAYYYVDVTTVWGNDLQVLKEYLESISTLDGSAYIDGYNGTNYYSMSIDSEGLISMSYLTWDESYPYGPFIQYGWYLSFEHGGMDSIPTQVIRYYQLNTDSSADVNGSYLDGSFYYSFYSYDMENDVLNEAVTLTGELVNEMLDFFETFVYQPAGVNMR